MTDHIMDDHRGSGQAPLPNTASPAGAVLYAREFDILLRLGRAKGFLEQDDLMSVLRSVELTPDVIIDVVLRVRAEGIEFVDAPDDAGDLRSVPPTTAVLDTATSVAGGSPASPAGPQGHRHRRCEGHQRRHGEGHEH